MARPNTAADWALLSGDFKQFLATIDECCFKIMIYYPTALQEVEMKVIRLSNVKKVPTILPSLFTGTVSTQSVVGTDLSKNFLINQVNFGSGVRNKFHKHSAEQILIVTEGKGIVATANEEVTVSLGDVVYIPAGEKHWHGAVIGTTFSHLYVTLPDNKTTQLED